MSHNKRIAFGCTARVGKDTACEYLQRKIGGITLRFSAPLYDILHYAQSRAGFDAEKDRKFLQWVGTEWAREKNPNVWVDCLRRDVQRYKDDNIFVSDLRFPNEVDALKEMGFTVVLLRRNHECHVENSSHASETALQDGEWWDCVIDNNGTLDEFYAKLDVLVNTTQI